MFAEYLQYVFDLGNYEISQLNSREWEILFLDGFRMTRSNGFESELRYASDNNEFDLEVVYHDEQGGDYYIVVE